MGPSDVKSETTSLNSLETIPTSVTCIKKQTAVHVCSNADCDKYAFVCASPDCECNQEHEFCPLTVLKNFSKAIKNKTVSLKPFERTIDCDLDHLIDQASLIRDSLIPECNQEYEKHFGLDTSEVEFLDALEKDEVKDIRGKDVFKLEMNMKTLTKKATKFKQFHDKIKGSIKRVSEELEKANREIAWRLSILKGKMTTLSESKIIDSFEDEKIVEGFFTKKIKMARLLYRASEHNFMTNKFHDLCDGKGELLIVCETENGKILGGYTPLQAYSTNKQAVDYSSQSFLYSVSKNVKFNQVNESNTFYLYSSTGPYFGSSPDFVINNQANVNNSSANFSSSFTNPNYPGNSQKTNSEILGSYNNQFKLKQWEVFTLEFD